MRLYIHAFMQDFKFCAWAEALCLIVSSSMAQCKCDWCDHPTRPDSFQCEACLLSGHRPCFEKHLNPDGTCPNTELLCYPRRPSPERHCPPSGLQLAESWGGREMCNKGQQRSLLPCRMPKSDAVPSSGAVEDSGASSSCISQQHGTPLLHRSTPLELWRIVVFTVTDAVPSSGAVEVCCVHSRCNSSIEHRYLHSPKNIQHPTQCPALELWRMHVCFSCHWRGPLVSRSGMCLPPCW